MKIIDAPIDKIMTDLSVRQQFGELSSMIRTIDAYGLLHPVGITKDYQLVYGLRRLQACRKMGWTTIPAVFVADVKTPCSIMKVENQFRKDLTPEEQVRLAQKLEEEGNRNAPAFWRSLGINPEGQVETGESENGADGHVWQDLAKHDGEINKKSKVDKNEPSGQVCKDLYKPDHKNKKKSRTDEVIAKAVGLGNQVTYRKAETVVNKGSRFLKDAMNQKKVSIDAAYELAKLPEKEQAAINYDDKQAVKEKVRQIRKPPEKTDMNKPDINRVVKLTSDWPEEQLLMLIEVLKQRVKGN